MYELQIQRIVREIEEWNGSLTILQNYQTSVEKSEQVKRELNSRVKEGMLEGTYINSTFSAREMPNFLKIASNAISPIYEMQRIIGNEISNLYREKQEYETKEEELLESLKQAIVEN